MKIRCTIQNASEEINGIKFAPHKDGGVVSVDDVPGDVADALLTIDGYEAVEDGDVKAAKQSEAKKKSDAKSDAKATEQAAGQGGEDGEKKQEGQGA